MSIDWSKAPEDATHYDVADGDPNAWMKKDGDYWYVWVSSGNWSQYAADIHEVQEDFIPRPKAPEAEWVDGLPPVGCECEYTARTYSSAHPSIDPNLWYRCKIIAYHDGAVWTSDNGIRRLSNTRFRPIRTKEQRQKDELADLIAEHIEIDMANDSFQVGVGDAVDAVFKFFEDRYKMEPKP